MKQMRKLVALLLIACMLFMASACNSNPEQSDTIEPDTTNSGTATEPESQTGTVTTKSDINFAVSLEPPTLDPIKIDNVTSYLVMTAAYEGLMKMDENMSLTLGLAESYEQVDELTYRFKLRQGVKFQNGEELKASDVVFSLQRLAAEPLKESVAAPLDAEGIVAEDDYTVIVKTKYPYSPILTALASTSFSIVSQKAVESMGEDEFARHPVGTGPWKFSSWTTGSEIVFERFDDYWDGAAICEKLVFKIIPEASSRVIALEAGDVDIIADVPSLNIQSLESNPDTKVLSKPGMRIFACEFNQLITPFNDVRFRQALMYATDVQSICDVVWEGTEEAALVPLIPSAAGYTLDGVTIYEYNPEKAKELLAECGYADGIDVSIATNEDTTRNKICVMLQDQWKDVGVNLTIDVHEQADYTAYLRKMEYDMMLAGLNNVTNDTDASLYFSFNSQLWYGAGNFTAYANDKVDELLDLARQSGDISESTAYYEEVLRILTADAVWLPICVPSTVVGIRSNVNGFEISANGIHNTYHKIYFT